jgi:hypothetical protein
MLPTLVAEPASAGEMARGDFNAKSGEPTLPGDAVAFLRADGQFRSAV